MKTVDGRVPPGSGSRPSDRTPTGFDRPGVDPSRDGAAVGRPFRDVLAEAYDWLVDDDGYLWGLVAGDMGYDKTDTKLADLLTAAQTSEWDRFYATGVRAWPVHMVVGQLITVLAKATEPPASATDARRAETGTGSVHEGPIGAAETPSPTPAPLPMED